MKKMSLKSLSEKIDLIGIEAYGIDGSNLDAERDGQEAVHQMFLNRCNELLFNYFKMKYGLSFNFSALSYRNPNTQVPFDFIKEKKEDFSYKFNDEVLEKSDILEALFEDFIEQAKREETINLTTVLTENITNKSVFKAYNLQKDPGSDIDSDLSLSPLIYSLEYDEFARINADRITEFRLKLNGVPRENEKYGRYIWNYKKIVDAYIKFNPGKSFFLYFIRPNDLVSDYKILLSVSTNKPLSDNDLGGLDFVLNKIVGKTALENYKNLLKARARQETQRNQMNFIELNTYHHLGNNLRGLSELLAIGEEKDGKLSKKQIAGLIQAKNYVESLITNSSNTLKIYRTYFENRLKTNDRSLVRFSGFLTTKLETVQLVDGIKISRSKFPVFTEEDYGRWDPELVVEIILSVIQNMNAEYLKLSNSDKVKHSGPTIELEANCRKNNYGGQIFEISLRNNYTTFRLSTIRKAGFEPLKSAKSSGLGLYFLNSTLRWAGAQPYTTGPDKNRHLKLSNIEEGVSIKFYLLIN